MSLKFTVKGWAEQCVELTLDAFRTDLTTNVFWQSVPCLWICVRKRFRHTLGEEAEDIIVSTERSVRADVADALETDVAVNVSVRHESIYRRTMNYIYCA